MILKKGERRHALSEEIDERSCVLCVWTSNPETNPDAHLFMLYQVENSTMAKLVRDFGDLRGRPTSYTVEVKDGASQIVVHPIPDEDVTAKLRYHPAMKEI